MKVITSSLVSILVSFSLSQAAFSQTNSTWEPIYLTVTGHNMIEGVEAFFKAGKCNGEDVVFVKFINHNSQEVRLEWYDAIFTQELKWINKENPGDKKILTINGNKEAKGNCSSNIDNSSAGLIIKLSDFIKDPKSFKRYASSNLEIFLIKK